jgi:phosphoglycerate kinase
MKLLAKIRRKDLSKEVVLVRVDFNVEPTGDSLRLRSALPTVKYLLDKNARVVLLSHKGRPAGCDESLTLRDAGVEFGRILGRPVQFLTGFDFQNLKREIQKSSSGTVMLLENLRFNPGEEKNDRGFANQLASLGTMFVNDAFAVSHRANASVAAITEFLPSYAGLRFSEEITILARVMKRPAHPLIIIIGGAKAADKLGMIDYFWEKADWFILGGGPANTVLKAKGVDIQSSIHDADNLEFAKKLARSEKMLTPHDWISGDRKILDIGPSSVRRFGQLIAEAKTIIWNGPMGQFEDPRYRAGSAGIAAAIAKSGAFSVVGGGETVELITELGLEKKFSFLSTGGGAMLQFLAGKKLPGLEALNS